MNHKLDARSIKYVINLDKGSSLTNRSSLINFALLPKMSVEGLKQYVKIAVSEISLKQRRIVYPCPRGVMTRLNMKNRIPAFFLSFWKY